MLSIHVMCLGQEDYYLSLAQEGYYLNGGEPNGFFCGSGVSALRLQRTVTAKALHALMLGYSPDGIALVRNAVKNQRKQKVDADFEEKRDRAARPEAGREKRAEEEKEEKGA